MIRITLEPNGIGDFQAVMPDGRRLFWGKHNRGKIIEAPKPRAILGAALHLVAEGMDPETVVVFRDKGSVLDTNPLSLAKLIEILARSRDRPSEAAGLPPDDDDGSAGTSEPQDGCRLSTGIPAPANAYPGSEP